MKRSRIGFSAVALLSASALVLAGCSASEEPAEGDSAAIITTNGSEPQQSLIPTNTTETGGGKVITSIFAGLVSYTADGDVVNEVAKSIESEDGQNWTVTLNDGWTFTNGEPVTSDSFVKAWSYGALLDNAQSSSYFFDNIEGFSYDENSELTGLEVVSDTEFTVALINPEADFPLRLGYSAFMPLPESAWDDLDAFGENPVGNGPYMIAEDGWQHDVQIDLVTNPEYDGVRKPANGGVSIIFYTSQDAAYADALSGNLDILDAVPDSAFETYESDFPGRSVNQPAAIFQAFNMPYYLEHWSGDEGKLRRAAISMSIDRAEITDVIFQGTRTPATDFTSPVIAGHSDNLAGAEVLDFNPEEAVKLWAEADAISPYGDTVFDLAYNADGGHQAWVDAVANSISNTLGIEAVGKAYPTFKDALNDRDANALTGGTRAGWQADYPSLYNFLGPLYVDGAGSNKEGYSSPEFEKVLAEGASASSVEEATAKYQEAQEILLVDLPSIPLWYSNVTGVYSDSVDNVVFGWDSVPLYDEVTKG